MAEPPVINEVVGLDIGTARTGIARVHMVARVPEPLCTLPTMQVKDYINALVQEQRVDAIVFGLPRDMNLNETEQTRLVRQWVATVAKDWRIPMFWQDETATTIAAHNTELKLQYPDADKDSLAACVILLDFIANNNRERVVS